MARILGLTTFGLDVIENDQGLHVIDVNLIPSCRQCPEWEGDPAQALVRAAPR